MRPPFVSDERWTPPQSRVDSGGSRSRDRAAGSKSRTSRCPSRWKAKAIVDGTLRAPWRWERLLVESSVIGSEERWERRITGLERELRLRREELADEDENRAAGLDRDIRDLDSPARIRIAVDQGAGGATRPGDLGRVA